MIGESVSTYQSDRICPACGGTLSLAMKRGQTAYTYWYRCNSPESCQFETDPNPGYEPSLDDFSHEVRAEFVEEYGDVPTLDEDYRVNEVAFTSVHDEAQFQPA